MGLWLVLGNRMVSGYVLQVAGQCSVVFVPFDSIFYMDSLF